MPAYRYSAINGKQPSVRFPDPVAFGVGTFNGVRHGAQSLARTAKKQPPLPPLSGGKHNIVPPDKGGKGGYMVNFIKNVLSSIPNIG